MKTAIDLRPFTGAHWLIMALRAEGVDTIFGYPGGAIMPFYDALVDCHLRHVLVRHEQGASLAANGYARSSGRVGVCVATSGPGASNLVTGIADAMLDSVPIVCVTGQVPSHLLGSDAFQELDIYNLTMPVVKHSFLVRSIDQLPWVVRESFRLAQEGRPGPVLIDFPKDIQTADASHLPAHCPAAIDRPAQATKPCLCKAAKAILAANKPVVYAGGGVILAEAVDEFRGFIASTLIPTALTLRGLGCLPWNHPQLLGMLGMHGTRVANIAVQESDLLVVVGARFDDRATGKLSEFAPLAQILHVDADASEVSKLRHADHEVIGDVRASLVALTQQLSELMHDEPYHRTQNAQSVWRQHCISHRDQLTPRYDAPGKDIYAPALLKRLSEIVPKRTIISCDVGQHQMWVAQHCHFEHPRDHLTSGALGTMGFGLPAAIGAQFAHPNRLVILISGDGSFLMNVQELATISRCRLPIKVILLDNHCLGMVRQWQELFFAERYSETDLSDNPDFVALVAAFGIRSRHIENRMEVDAALHEFIHDPGPGLLHVSIDAKANVWPLVPPNTANSTMLEANQISIRQDQCNVLPA